MLKSLLKLTSTTLGNSPRPCVSTLAPPLRSPPGPGFCGVSNGALELNNAMAPVFDVSVGLGFGVGEGDGVGSGVLVGDGSGDGLTVGLGEGVGCGVLVGEGVGFGVLVGGGLAVGGVAGIVVGTG